MRGVTPFELVRMRRNSDLHADVNVHVWRPTPATDSRGGKTKTYARIRSYLARKAPLTTVQSVEQVWADKLGGNQGWWFTMPKDADVRLDDQLRSSSRHFEVVGFDTDRSEAISTRVLCRELT